MQDKHFRIWGAIILLYIAAFYIICNPLSKLNIGEGVWFALNIILLSGLIMVAANLIPNPSPNMMDYMILIALLWIITGCIWGGLSFIAAAFVGYTIFGFGGGLIEDWEDYGPKIMALMR